MQFMEAGAQAARLVIGTYLAAPTVRCQANPKRKEGPFEDGAPAGPFAAKFCPMQEPSMGRNSVTPKYHGTETEVRTLVSDSKAPLALAHPSYFSSLERLFTLLYLPFAPWLAN